MLQQHHAEAISFLAGGAGGAPESQRARMLARFDEPGSKSVRSSSKGGRREEAGLVDGHASQWSAQGHISSGFETPHEFVEMGDAMVAQSRVRRVSKR